MTLWQLSSNLHWNRRTKLSTLLFFRNLYTMYSLLSGTYSLYLVSQGSKSAPTITSSAHHLRSRGYSAKIELPNVSVRMSSMWFYFWPWLWWLPHVFRMMASASLRFIFEWIRSLFLPWEQLWSLQTMFSGKFGKNLLIYSWIWSVSVNSWSTSSTSRLL